MDATGDLPTTRWERSPSDVAYRRVRDNVSTWVGAFPDVAGTPVPACPTWTVRDVVAHLVEVSWRVAKRWGRVAGSPPFPTSDAEPRVLLRLWGTTGAMVDRILVERQDQRAPILVMDALTHELDIREAIGQPAPVEHDAMREAFDVLVTGFGRSVSQRGLPAVLIRADGDEWVAGAGPPKVTVTGGRYDLYRSLSGRRTPEQIAALTWNRPPRAWLPAFEWGPFHPPARPVERPVGRLDAA